MPLLPHSSSENEPYRAALRHAIRSSKALLEFVGVTSPMLRPEVLQQPDFPVLVPRGFASRMKYGDPEDPLLRQVLALPAELVDAPGFIKDPLAETQTRTGVNPAPALIKKYHGRALLITTSGCAINCRYCFRRHFPYAEHRDQKHTQALAAISADSSISEIILSGGDPLLLDDHALATLIEKFEAIPHLKRLRIHSRIPVVLPERITPQLLSLLKKTTLKTALVIHANHPNELDNQTARALNDLKQASALLLNQSVLLRDVNDCAPVLISLAEKLYDQSVQPYYLHMPDRVAGTSHFHVNDEEAKIIYGKMQAHLPGYLLPRLVREIPGENSKQLLDIQLKDE